MNQGANSAAQNASVRPTRHVSFTDHGDIIVRVPATFVELLTVLAGLIALAVVPVAVVGVLVSVSTLPLALVSASLLLASALFAPFAAIALVAALLG